jgi:hypothetical protein
VVKLRLVLIAALVAFDFAVALLATLSLVTPQVAVALLLTNPLALILERHLRARRPPAPFSVRRD